MFDVAQVRLQAVHRDTLCCDPSAHVQLGSRIIAVATTRATEERPVDLAQQLHVGGFQGRAQRDLGSSRLATRCCELPLLLLRSRERGVFSLRVDGLGRIVG